MSCRHKDVRFVMGQHPVAAICRGCGMRLLANGGGWVSKQEAEAAQKRIGWRAAL